MRTAVRPTPLSLFAGCTAVVVVLGLGMFLYDHSRRDSIAKGVTVAGIDLGGLNANQARTELERRLTASLDQPLIVRSGGSSWSLDGRQAQVTVNVSGMVDQAVAVSRAGSIFSRTFRELSGGSLRRSIPLQVSYSHAAVRALTAQVRAAVDRPARDAAVQPSTTGLTTVPEAPGTAVNSPLLGTRIEHALTGIAQSRTVTVPTRPLSPKVTISQLAARYPAYIVIDREAFQLRFYDRLKLADTYPIAVGMQGLETPPGLYHVQWKQVDPPWYVPKSAWAGALAGKVIPPGPEDPLKARFMSFDGGAGIHGIDPSEYGTIGHDASHGCVRMTIPDVIALYSRTPVGTPVYIV
jgi:lipoprotein-anchoring transpeptidase ErfK/SrfK